MNNSGSELERWLTGGELMAAGDETGDAWEPGFNADRQVVRSRLGGFYQKLFLRPDVFTQRFYHEIYPLPIEDWDYRERMELFDGFCQVEVAIELRYQATLTFAQRNAEALPDINTHIKRTFQCMLTDIVHKEVHALNDGHWVQGSLLDIEKKIAVTICELLMMQNIQSRAICKIFAEFKEFPNVQPGKDNVYLHVLKQSHELNESKNQAYFRRHQAMKEQKLLHKQQELEILHKFAEIERRKRAQDAADQLALLEDEERQLAARLAIEKRMHAEQVRHQNELKEMESEAELLAQQKIRMLQQEAELQQMQDKLKHQERLEEQKLEADTARREKQLFHQSEIQDKKTRIEVERYEKQQAAWRAAKLKLHEQQLALKKRQQQLEQEAEQELKQQELDAKKQHVVMPFQKLEKFEDGEKVKRRSETLRNEIELSLLEKQRLELEMAITEMQKKTFQE
ncbi:coiled-coil domain-containing protein [Methylomarinum vadi]|uniref:hypothetical protein n=1 Tax=Methylomarinum vadi TaxID=438855 RepID=UPI00056B354D|nr:hypothetical protein [Methylomarinum vadi]